jgi:hypothetical protein
MRTHYILEGILCNRNEFLKYLLLNKIVEGQKDEGPILRSASLAFPVRDKRHRGVSDECIHSAVQLCETLPFGKAKPTRPFRFVLLFQPCAASSAIQTRNIALIEAYLRSHYS